MADIILHRRSLDTGSVPTTASLGIAQFAINVPDGKVFIHKSSSVSQSIVSVVTTDSITTGSITLTATASAGLFIGTFTGSFSGTTTNADTASYAIKAVAATQVDIFVQNKTGVTIPKGKIVRVSGSVGDNPLITTASYDSEMLSHNAIGFVIENIDNDGTGSIVTQGILTGVNTSGFTSGDQLYLGATGSYINTTPTAPLHGVRVGEVLRVHASQGSILVRIDNGYELGELHDIIDNTNTASFGDLLVRSGSAWINSKLLTGSYTLSGSLHLYQSASVSGTNIFGTASWADNTFTASYIEFGYPKELHVSTGGSDSTGDGTLLKPFRTVGKALHSASSAIQIVLHPGTYVENPTVSGSASNVTITTLNSDIGSITQISGSLTVEQYSASTKLLGLAIENLIHTGSKNLYVQNTRIYSGVSKTGNGYLDCDNIACESPATFNVTAPGTVVVRNSALGQVIVNNSTANVNLTNNVAMVTPTCTLGTMLIDGGVVYSATTASGAVFSGVGAVVALSNLLCLTPANNTASITLNALSGYSIQNVGYHKASSSLGISLANRSQFQHIEADGISGSFTGSLVGSTTNADTASHGAWGFKIVSSSIYSYKQTTTAAGIYSIPFTTGSAAGAVLSYTVVSQSNARTGQILATWANNTGSFSETTTPDVGNTSGVVATYALGTGAGDANFRFNCASPSWSLSLYVTLI